MFPRRRLALEVLDGGNQINSGNRRARILRGLRPGNWISEGVELADLVDFLLASSHGLWRLLFLSGEELRNVRVETCDDLILEDEEEERES